MSTDPRVARDDRQQVISDAIWDHARAAFEGNVPSGAIAHMAEEDLVAALESLVERLDEAGLTVVSAPAPAGEDATLPDPVPLTDEDRLHGTRRDGVLLFHEAAVERIKADTLAQRGAADRATLAAVRALADEWERLADEGSPAWTQHGPATIAEKAISVSYAVSRLRALDGPDAGGGRRGAVPARDDADAALLRAVETIKQTGGAVEIAGVRIEPCDEYGKSVTVIRAEQAELDCEEFRQQLLAHRAPEDLP